MSLLQQVDDQLDALASVVDTDLEGALEFIEALREVVTVVKRDVIVARAVLELDNAVGYPVGHVSFDGEERLFKFTPHIDAEEA